MMDFQQLLSNETKLIMNVFLCSKFFKFLCDHLTLNHAVTTNKLNMVSLLNPSHLTYPNPLPPFGNLPRESCSLLMK